MVSHETVARPGESMTFRLFLLCSFVLLARPQDILAFLQPLRPALVLTLLTVAATMLGARRNEISAALSTREAKRYLLFCLIIVIGIPFAYHRRAAFESFFLEYTSNILFFVVLVCQVTSLQRLKSLAWVICLGTAFYGIVGALPHSTGDTRLQIGAGMFDPNDTAYVLVSFFPLCFYFIRFNEGALKRLVAIVAIGGAVTTILLTGSRGGILAFGAVLLIIFLTRVAGVGKGTKVLLALLLAAAALLLGSRIDVERYLTLTDLSSDYNLSSPGGRMELWQAAIVLSLTNPLTGVGIDCFPWAHYLARLDAGDTYRVYHAAHNSFLQVAAEVGLIGFAVYMLIIVRGLQTFSRTSRMQSQAGSAESRQLGALGGYMLLGFVGLLVAGLFLTHGYSVFLTLYFGLAAVVERLQAAQTAAVAREAAESGRYEGSGITAR